MYANLFARPRPPSPTDVGVEVIVGGQSANDRTHISIARICIGRMVKSQHIGEDFSMHRVEQTGSVLCRRGLQPCIGATRSEMPYCIIFR